MTNQNVQDMAKNQKLTLDAFFNALRREAHVLQNHPDLLWQQLHNRLQWEDELVPNILEPELKLRSLPTSTPWIKNRMPPWESETLIRTLKGHTSNVNACTFSPDGRFIASASDDETVRVWAAATGQLLHILVGHTQAVKDCVFSPDGRFIASVGDSTVRVWNIITGEALHILEGHTDYLGKDEFKSEIPESVVRSLLGHKNLVEACSFSSDGYLIVSAGLDRTLRVWDAITGELLRTLQGHKSRVTSCTFSPDGFLIASASWDRTVRLWNSNTGEILHTLEGHTDTVMTCAFSPDGLLLVSAGVDRKVRVWDVIGSKALYSLEGHDGRVQSCVFSPDGRLILTAGSDRMLRLWNVITGEILSTLVGHSGSVNACAFSPDGRFIASVSTDKMVRIWEADASKLPYNPEGYVASVDSCEFSPDGRLIASGGGGTVRVWNSKSGKLLRNLECDSFHFFTSSLDGQHIGYSGPVSISPDGQLIASTVSQISVLLWDADTGQLLRTIQCHTGNHEEHKWSREALGFICSAYLWDAASGKLRHRFEDHEEIWIKCEFFPDGNLITSPASDTFIMWDVISGEALQTWKFSHYFVHLFAFSPDGRFIVTTDRGRDNNLLLWDTATLNLLCILEGHTDDVKACEFSPDGRFIVTVSMDMNLCVWDTATGEMVGLLPLPGSLVSLGLHPWVPQLVCGDKAGSMYRVEIIGIKYTPIMVTAVNSGQGLKVRCPACQQSHPVKESQLGSELTCPNPDCIQQLKINLFITRMA